MSPDETEKWVFGYARVSTDDQNLALQRDALKKAGVPAERIYTDQMSGATVNRPGLMALRKALRPGDSLYVWRLDRLGRSVSELDALARELREEGVALKSLTEVFDTSSAFGTFMFQILSVFAEFERNLIRERTMAGLVAAKARGSKAGPKPKMTPEQVQEAQGLLLDGKMTATEIAKKYGISKPTLFRYIPGGREALMLNAQQTNLGPTMNILITPSTRLSELRAAGMISAHATSGAIHALLDAAASPVSKAGPADFTLEQLGRLDLSDVAKQPGVGKAGMAGLRNALQAAGLRLNH